MRTTALVLSAVCLGCLALEHADVGQAAQGTVAAGEKLPDGLRLGVGDQWQPGVRSALYSSDGRTLVTAGAGADIRFWDLRSRRLLRTIQPDPNENRGINTMRLSANGKTLCILTLNSAVLGYDFASGKQLFRIAAEGVQFAAFDISADGAMLATGTCKNEMILWNTATQQKVRTIEGDRSMLKKMQADGHALQGIEQPVGVVALSPDGKSLAAVALYDWTVRVYNVTTGRLQHAFPTNNFSYCGYAQFSPDGAYLAATRFTGPGQREGDEVITIWDLATGKQHQQFQEGAFFGFAMSADWKWIAADGAKGELHVLERATGKRRSSVASHPNIGNYSLAFSPDCDNLAACNGTSSLILWDLRTGRDALAVDK
jgi:WD40 repeat protein